MQKKKTKIKSICYLILVVLFIILFGWLIYYGIGEKKIFSLKNIKQGLDLRGGISIIYQADKEKPTQEEMNSAKSMIRARLDRKNFTEAEVATQNINRIRVDIPGVDNAQEAVEEIGQTAQLTFRDENGNVLLNGTQIKDARKQISQNNGMTEISVVLEFTSNGKKIFEEITEKNIGKKIAICLDEDIISAPVVNEKISGGEANITGSFDSKQAEELANLIRAGSLPFNLKIISLDNVGAKLGAEALESSLLAGIIGTGLVILFMLVIYKLLGFVADIALVIYISLILIFLSLFNITLTLPGIAGIILSIGMAVDANVIIFERMKEEIEENKKTFRVAVRSGFNKALSAILDGNITTLIAAIVLYIFGSGPIKGFAQTLSLGIILSMFTALFITRFLLNNLINIGLDNSKSFGFKNHEQEKNLDANNKK